VKEGKKRKPYSNSHTRHCLLAMSDAEDDDVFTTDEEENEKEEEEEISAVGRATALKEEGNVSFRERDFAAAAVSYGKAIQVLQEVVNAKDSSSDDKEESKEMLVKVFTNQSAAFVGLQKYAEAVRAADGALKIDATWKKAWSRKGQAHLKMGEVQRARDDYTELLQLEPKSKTGIKGSRECSTLERLTLRAQTHLDNKQYRNAYADAQQAMDIAPMSVAMHKVKLKAMAGQGMYNEVMKYSTFLLRNEMDDNEILLVRAQAFYWNSNFPLCMKHLQQVLRRDPDYRPAQVQLKKLRKLEKTKKRANEAFRRGDWTTAIDTYTQVLSIEPDHKVFNSKIYCNRAAALLKLRRREEALRDCNQAVALDTSYTKAYLRRAQCFFEIGGEMNLENCIRDYEHVLKKYDRGSAPRDIKQKLHEARIALKRSKKKDYYKILGVSHAANEREIKKAYRKAAVKWHPDKWSSKSESEKKMAEKNFKDINAAFEALSDPKKRARYDAGEDDLDGPGQGGMRMNPNDIFAQMFASQMGGGGRGGFPGGFSFNMG